MHALVINFNATFLFHSLLLVVNSSMKYQIYTKCIVLWDPELKFSSSWSFFNTCVKYMYWYDKTRSIIQRTSLNAIGTSLTSFNAIGTSLELFRQAEKPLGPLRQVEKKLSQLERKDRAMFRLLSTVSLKTNARLPNTKQACLNFNVLRSQGLALQLSHPHVYVNNSILQWIICLWNMYALHFFHENLLENVECLIYRMHMYKSHVCRN